jgi:hypothetical protein
MAAGVRLRCGPRNDGMAQNPHVRSHPSAIFTYAHGALDRGRGRLSRSRLGTGRRPALTDSDTGTPKAGHQIGLGEGVGQLVAVALGQAAGDDQPGALLPGVGQREDGLDRLLPGGVDEGARVDDHEVGDSGVIGRHHALGEEGADDLLGVDLVLGAAERLEDEVASAYAGPTIFFSERPRLPCRSATRRIWRAGPDKKGARGGRGSRRRLEDASGQDRAAASGGDQAPRAGQR